MNIKSLLSLTLGILILTSCGSSLSLSKAQKNHQIETPQSAEKEEYVFFFTKKPDDAFSIKEIKVYNEEGVLIQPLGFAVKTKDRKTTILNLKGYSEFVVVATYPGGKLDASSAEVVYEMADEKKTKGVLKVKSFE